MKTITRELIAKVCILTFTVCLLLGIVSSKFLKENALENMDALLTTSVNAYANVIDNSIELMKSEIETFANEADVNPDMTVEEMRAVCEEYEKKYGFLRASFIDSKGMSYDGVDLSERDYFTTAMAGTTYMSSPLVSKRPGANNAVVLYVAAKMVNDKGYEGVGFTEISNDVFSQIIKDVKVSEKGYGFIVDKTGTIIAHPDGSVVESFTNYIKLAQENEAYKEVGDLISEVISNKAGKKSMEFQGSRGLIVYTPIAGPEGWILVF